jgi:ABC-type sugar transport system ATPase subunit
VTSVTLDGISKTFARRPVLQVEHLELDAGGYSVLCGPSGSGKTTLLRIVAGLETTDAGRVFFGDRDVTRFPPEHRGVAMVPAEGSLLPHLGVAENVLLSLHLAGVARREAESRLANVAEMLALVQLLGRKPHELSTGERQRAALARALAGRPSLLLLDEPLASLDAPARAALRLELRRLHGEMSLTTLHVTHDQTEALAIADRIVLLKDGRVIQSGTPAEVYHSPSTRWAAGFVGSPPMNLLPGEVCSTPAGSHFALPGAAGHAPARLPLISPMGRDAVATTAAVAGFRPENAEIGAGGRHSPTDSAFTACFVRAEFFGSVAHWRMERGGVPFVLVASPARPTPAPGGFVFVSVPPHALAVYSAGDAGPRIL